MHCHSSTPTRARDHRPYRRTIRLALALLLVGSASVARAEPPPDDELSTAAREILSVHCPPCHDTGTRLSTDGNGHPLPLDLAAIARDPTLIRPGNPDGSPVYTTLVRRLFTPQKPPAPTIEQLATLRAWIERLPASAASCPVTRNTSRSAIEQLAIRHAVKSSTPVAALRVLTLAHVDGGCTPADRLDEWRRSIRLFLGGLAGSTKPALVAPLDDSGNLLAINIQAFGWDGDHWRALTGAGQRAARSVEPLIVRADWLIVHVLRGELGARSANLQKPPAHKPRHFHDPEITELDRAIVEGMLARVTPPDELARHTELVLKLAQLHLAPAGLSRVAVELGVARADLERQFDDTAVVMGLLPRLAYGAVPRDQIEDGWLLLGKIGGTAPPVRTNVPIQFDAVRPQVTPETPVELQLYADRGRYKVGDEVKLTVRSNVDCRLTVISIDVSGHGTVIFPNDFTPKDLLSAHLNLALPARDAGYRLRVKEKGRERVVALCTRAAGLIDGITHDFERQRFQELGPYGAFLDNALRNAQKRRAAALAAAAAAAEEHAAREAAKPEGSRRASPEPPAAPAEPPGPLLAPLHQIWRTGIVIEVE